MPKTQKKVKQDGEETKEEIDEKKYCMQCLMCKGIKKEINPYSIP